MRENMGIYRGKRVDSGEMVKGFYSCVTDNYTPKNRCYITTFKSLDNGEIVLTGRFEVIPETVGQFSGLTDRNRTEIFEGDIVESKFTKKPYPVCFGEYTYTDEDGEESGAYGWYNEEKGGYVTAFSQPDCWAIVIGNIHDNPELLGGDKNGFGL